MHKVSLLVLAAVLVLTFSDQAEAYRRRRGATPASAQLHGITNVIRARGQAERILSRARINNEEARIRYSDNQKKWTETYFAKKEINAAYVAKETAQRQQLVQ